MRRRVVGLGQGRGDGRKKALDLFGGTGELEDLAFLLDTFAQGGQRPGACRVDARHAGKIGIDRRCHGDLVQTLFKFGHIHDGERPAQNQPRRGITCRDFYWCVRVYRHRATRDLCDSARKA